MDDYDEEVDPSGCLLEISAADSAEDEEVNTEKATGKAPEISLEEETAAGSSRMSGTKMFLWRVCERLANWERSDPNRQTGRFSIAQKGILAKDRRTLVFRISQNRQ